MISHANAMRVNPALVQCVLVDVVDLFGLVAFWVFGFTLFLASGGLVTGVLMMVNLSEVLSGLPLGL